MDLFIYLFSCGFEWGGCGRTSPLLSFQRASCTESLAASNHVNFTQRLSGLLFVYLFPSPPPFALNAALISSINSGNAICANAAVVAADCRETREVGGNVI